MENKISYSEFIEALRIVNRYKEEQEQHLNYIKKVTESMSKFSMCNADDLIFSTNLSVRALNCLKMKEEEFFGVSLSEAKVKDFGRLSIYKLISARGMGKKTIDEIKELCFYANVKFLE